MEARAKVLDREVYQDHDSDRYLIPGERVFDNAADDLETIALSERSISLLPQKKVSQDRSSTVGTRNRTVGEDLVR